MNAFPFSDYPGLSPLGLFSKLKTVYGAPIILLESAVQDETNRISIVACDPIQTIETSNAICDTLRKNLQKCHTFPDNPYFSGGFIGSLTFESVFDFFPKYTPQHVEDLPRTMMYEFGRIYIFDHSQNLLLTLVHPDIPEEDTHKIFSEILPLPLPKKPPVFVPKKTSPNPEFLEIVESAKESIYAGEVFQLVLSKKFKTSLSTNKSIDIYQSLKTIEPTTHLILADYGIHGTYTCASPEIIGKKTGSHLLVSPIAGTRRRKHDESENNKVSQNLLNDPKENAEHDMLVDLGRNDLGRISKPGSVSVTNYKYLQAYQHVIHLLSDIESTIKPEYDAIDFLRSIFPAGTLSGAPKIRAINLIQMLELESRGLYGGATGIIEINGNLQMAINIRGVHMKDNVATVQVGAGIVKNSIPLHEWYELQNKSQTLQQIFNELLS